MNLSEKKSVAERFLKALLERDEALLRSVVAADACWSFPGTSLMSGVAAGIDSVVERARIVARYGVKMELKHIVFGHDNVALLLYNTGDSDERRLEEHLASVLTLKDGKIARIDTYLSDVPLANQYFV